MYTLQLDRCMCTILTRHASINQIKSHWKTSEGEKQAYICCMFVEGKSKTVFFPSDTLIYGICRDGTKNNNIRACEHLILGQFRMGARSAIYAPLKYTRKSTWDYYPRIPHFMKVRFCNRNAVFSDFWLSNLHN